MAGGGWGYVTSLQNPGLWEALPSQQSPKGDAATGYIPVCLSFHALADIGSKGFCFFYLLLFYFIMEAWACVSMYSCLCVCRHTCAQGDTHVCMRSVSGIMPQELSTLLSGARVSQLGLGDLPVSTSSTGCKCTPPQLSVSSEDRPRSLGCASSTCQWSHFCTLFCNQVTFCVAMAVIHFIV